MDLLNESQNDPDFMIHVVPTHDKLNRTHAEDPKCWCNPTMTYKDPETGKEVWSHKGYEELDQ